MARNRHQIEPYLRILYGHAFSMTKNEDDAHDLVQETLVRVLGAKNVPDDSVAFRVWLFRILRNLSIDRARRNWFEPSDIEQIDSLSTDAFWCHEEDQINALTVKMGFDKLPHGFREIISLIDLAGMTYIEASAVLDIAPGTVKSRLSRARQALMSKLVDESSNRLILKVGQNSE